MKGFKEFFLERTSFDLNFQSEEFFDDFFNKDDLSEHDKEMYPQFKGRNVVWLGYEEDRVRKVDPQYVSPREDNIFIPEKVKAVRDRVREVSGGADKLYLFTPVAEQITIDLEDVANTLMAAKENRLRMEYAMDEPFSTGDYELDEFLEDQDLWVENNLFGSGFDYEDVQPYLIEDGPDPKEDLKRGKIDQEEFEHIQDFVKAYRAIQNELQKAVDKNKGDLGKQWYRLRDGNHRAFGSIAAGEPYIYVTVAKNSNLV